MAREKRTGDLKIYVCTPVEEALRQLAEKEDRSISTYCYRVLEEHVALKIFKQKLGGSRQTS